MTHVFIVTCKLGKIGQGWSILFCKWLPTTTHNNLILIISCCYSSTEALRSYFYIPKLWLLEAVSIVDSRRFNHGVAMKAVFVLGPGRLKMFPDINI